MSLEHKSALLFTCLKHFITSYTLQNNFQTSQQKSLNFRTSAQSVLPVSFPATLLHYSPFSTHFQPHRTPHQISWTQHMLWCPLPHPILIFLPRAAFQTSPSHKILFSSKLDKLQCHLLYESISQPIQVSPKYKPLGTLCILPALHSISQAFIFLLIFWVPLK